MTHRSLTIVLLLLLSFLPATAMALSTKDLKGGCRSDWKKWQKRGGYGAVAVSGNGYCGFSWQAYSTADAIKGAIERCAKVAGKSRCVVIDQNNTLGSAASDEIQCRDARGLAGLEACSRVIANNPRAAFAFNNRGAYYEEQGDLEKALQEFRKAISLKDRYKDNVTVSRENYRRVSAALSQQKERRSKLNTVDARELCGLALNAARSDWESSPKYAVEVSEAARRHLTVADCQDAIRPGPVASPVDPHNLVMADVCRGAIDPSNSSQWSADVWHQAFVAEAQRRKMSINGCRDAIGLPHLSSQDDDNPESPKGSAQ